MKFVQHYNATKQLFLQNHKMKYNDIILKKKTICIKQLYKQIVTFAISFFQKTIVIVSSFTNINKWVVYSQRNVYFFNFTIY